MRDIISPLDGIRSPFGARRGAVVPFSPLELFLLGEQGVWYDPSDLTTLFQDAAGTTPVTAVEQPVGRMLDKSGRGNHATQATSAARPVLSARVNLLEKTEDLSAAYWSTATGLTSRVTASGFTTLTENTGTSTHRIGLEPSTTAALGTPITIVCSFKAGTRRYLQFQWDNNTLGVGAVVDTQNWTIAPLTGSGTVTASSITNLGAGEYQVSVTGFVSSGTTAVNLLIYGLSSATQNSVTYTGTSATIIAGKADLRVANDTALPVYQRVNTATDYDTVGFPTYLRFDGTDDSMATASINFTSTDKMTVFGGVRKLSDAAQGIAFELSASSSSNPGAFRIDAPRSNTENFAFISGGSTPVAAIQASGYAAPISVVATGVGNISGDQAILRLNGLQAAINTGDQGTGNYGNYPLYVGARAGTSLYYSGRLYSLIVRGAATTDTLIGQTEQWISNEMGGGFVPTGYDYLVDANGDFITDASGNPLYTQALYS